MPEIIEPAAPPAALKALSNYNGTTEGMLGVVKVLTNEGYQVDDALLHDERHLISNAVGLSDMHVDVGSKITLAKRDTVLIASDGLFDNLPISEITEIICQGLLADAGKKLVRVCSRRMSLDESSDRPHKPDDMSFILFRPC